MKNYLISDDLAQLHDKAIAAEKLVKIAMKLPFGYRKALRAATDAEKFMRLFWGRIKIIYPELSKNIIAYNTMTQTVAIAQEEDKNDS